MLLTVTLSMNSCHLYQTKELINTAGNRKQGEISQEVLEAVRSNVPEDIPIFMRVSATDYVEGGLDIDETIAIVNMVKDLVDVVDCSSAGSCRHASTFIQAIKSGLQRQ